MTLTPKLCAEKKMPRTIAGMTVTFLVLVVLVAIVEENQFL